MVTSNTHEEKKKNIVDANMPA